MHTKFLFYNILIDLVLTRTRCLMGALLNKRGLSKWLSVHEIYGLFFKLLFQRYVESENQSHTVLSVCQNKVPIQFGEINSLDFSLIVSAR